MAPFLTIQRDHGEGEVVVDQHDRALVRWSLDDEIDRRVLRAGIAELARIHRAAGATQILTLHAEPVVWRRGEDFDSFLNQVAQASLAPNDITLFSAHHMGSCRMGSDPATSVADGRGELHDVPGVWIGDASAFPTPSGGHPMIAIMALAHRTAGHIAASDAS
jgi:choline dehydrogenase-like flavoprotein